MMRPTIATAFFAVTLSLLFIACGSSVNGGEDACTVDSDCVPAACCHATACGAASNAPDCSDVGCSADCRAGTIDCGGSCFCQAGRCAAHLME